jgi:hypothetical protein
MGESPATLPMRLCPKYINTISIKMRHQTETLKHTSIQSQYLRVVSCPGNCLAAKIERL